MGNNVVSIKGGIAGRKSDLAAEIIAKGRNKVPVENKKGLWNGCFCF